ncbi:hypothetical protein GCM10018980_33770 [Streptomyces capoamus]|uniref:Uncharacterized protein n=1 Tax=Streptomyces capoamus TaxID=68183 RepID=A0A919EVQ3_9ACTN|nr:hypothetical protein GCM10010501_04390 [Streptomyces libani subsp. rufus]GHG51336.1 hypothetical protein GCM10018980_33770 [Streptomyces capoamus]
MHRTAPEPAGRDGRRQATLACGVASLTATAGRAPFNQHPRTREGRGELRARPRPARGRPAAPAGPARGALAHGRKDAR